MPSCPRLRFVLGSGSRTRPSRRPAFLPPAFPADCSWSVAGPRDAFTRLAELPQAVDAFGQPDPVRVRLTAEAENVLEEFARDVARRAVDATGAFAGALGKARGHVLRLALVLEYLWWCPEAG